MRPEHPTEALPIFGEVARGFDAAMRGYDRAQVDRYVAAAEEDFRRVSADRDAARAQNADLHQRLEQALAELDALREQLRLATEHVSADNVDEHVRPFVEQARAEAERLRLDAAAEAGEQRRTAAEDAARIRGSAQAEADRISATARERLVTAEHTYQQQLAEADAYRTAMEADLTARIEAAQAEQARLTAEATAERERLNAESAAERERLTAASTAEHERLTAESTAERERLNAESAAQRKQADEDFEIILRQRRTSQATMLAAQRRDAEQHAAELVAAAQEEVQRLHAYRDAMHASLRELHGRLGSALEDSLESVPPYATDDSTVPAPVAEQTTQQFAPAALPEEAEQPADADDAPLEHSASAGRAGQ
jgi:cell division septum initiation protein DivIVA